MIDFVNNSEPDLTAENLNKLQQDIGTVVSPTEPQGNERLKVWIQKGKNLFNKNNILSGYLLSEDGAITQNATYFVSAEYIPVLAETDIVVSSAITDIYRIAEYDNNKNLIKRTFNDNPSTRYKIKTTSTTAYIKISCTLAQVDNIQVEQNSEATKYEAYIEPKIYVLNNNDVYEEFKKEVETDWINLISGYNTFYRKINRIVEINLNIYDSTGFSVEETVNKLLGTLPEGFRPSKDINIPVFSRTIGGVFTNPLRLIVKTTGEVNIYNWGTTLKFEVIQAYLTYNV